MKSKIRVYATCFWQNDEMLLEDFKRYGWGQAKWKNLEFTTSTDYDIAILLTAPWRECHDLNPAQTVRFLTEPPASLHHCDISDIVCPMYLMLPWWIHSSSCQTLTKSNISQEKIKLLSVITSEQAYLEGHCKRLKLLAMLDEWIEDGLDIFGKQYSGYILPLMRNYRGELKDKYDGLLLYAYHFCCENSFVKGYFTEKLLDPIIAESLCFYDGCPDVEQFIDARAFIRIDVNDIEASLQTIFRVIEDGEYEYRLPYIIAQKKRLLYELNPLNIIWAQLNGYDLTTYFKL